MKRKLVVSWILVIAMLLCMAPAGFAAEDAPAEILIEGENPTSVTGAQLPLENAAFSGGNALKIQGNVTHADMPDGGYALAYAFTAEKAGLYQATVRSSRQGRLYAGDPGVDFNSPYYVQVNDGEPFTYREGSAYDQGIFAGNTDFAEYQFPVYINEGENTLRFILKNKRAKDNLGVFSLDCVKLNWQSSGMAYQPLLLEGEQYLDTNAPESGIVCNENAAFSGGREVGLVTSEPAPEGGYTLNYAVTAPQGGRYVMEVSGSTQGRQDAADIAASDAVSPYTIAMNGGTLAFQSFTGYEAGSGAGENRTKYRMGVGLNPGTNTISFHIGATQAGNTAFYLDYIKLLPVTDSMPGEFKVEGESFARASVKKAKDSEVRAQKCLSNGNVAYFQTGTGTENCPALDYTFWADAAGEYAIYTVCGSLGQAWTSDFTMQVNDGEPIAVNADATKLADMQASDNGLYKQYAVKSAMVSLRKGWNTMRLTPEEKATGKGYMLTVDYIRFVKAGADVVMGPYRSGGTMPEPVLTDNKAMMQIKYQPNNATDAYAEFAFFVGEEADYTLTVDMAAYLTPSTSWHSPAGISFDGGTVTKMVSEDTKGDGETANTTKLAGIPAVANVAYGRYQYLPPVHLTKGWHTFKIETLGAGPGAMEKNNYNRVLYFLGMRLKKDQTLGSGMLYLDNPALTAGERTTARPILFADNGDVYTETPEDLSFVSSDETVAEVAPDGTITAWNAGKSTITACVGSVTCEADVIVLGDGSSVMLHSAEANPAGENVKVRIASVGPQPADTSVQVFAVAYGRSGSISTSLKAVDVQNVAGLTSGQTSDLTFDLPGLQADDTVKVFVWDDMSNMAPLWTSTVAE